IDQARECTVAPLLRLQALDGATIDRLQLVQRRLRLGDLDQRGREAALARAVFEPAREERLAGAVIASHRLEPTPPGGDRLELFYVGFFVAFEARREQLEVALRLRTDGQRLDDLAALDRSGGDSGSRGHDDSTTPNCCASFCRSRWSCCALRSNRRT